MMLRMASGGSNQGRNNELSYTIDFLLDSLHLQSAQSSFTSSWASATGTGSADRVQHTLPSRPARITE